MKTPHLEILENTQLPTGQARAILHVMELEITALEKVLVTKSEFKEAMFASKNDLREAMSASKNDLREAMSASKNDLREAMLASKKDLSEAMLAGKKDLNEAMLAGKNDLREAMLVSKNDLREAMAAAKHDLQEAFHVLDLKIEALRGEMRAAIAGIEGRLTRWVFTCILGQTAVLLGAMYFVVKYLRS